MSAAPALPPRRNRRGAVIVLSAAAAALVMWSGSATWVTFIERDPAALAAPISVPGRSVTTVLAVAPLAAAMLCLAAVISSRRWVRATSAVAGLTAAAAVGHAAARLIPAGALRVLHSGLPVSEAAAARIHVPAAAAGLAGLVLLLAASVAAARDVATWRAMSSRYQRRSHQPRTTQAAAGMSAQGRLSALDPAQAWAALDAGDDPTAEPPGV
ncbi:MAG: Trp biosynthesis-associated membrane protein [Actinomycetales bacterium]|nr:Trp biosynthesis-associated membrane protein [Actinomycetales bacterium]